MTDRIIDLHTHSTASDGTFSPRDLARYAKENGLTACALTDHDTLDGAAEFLDECKRLDIEGIAGVEISAQHDKTMHIVGLFVDYENGELKDKLSRLRGGREIRNKKILSLLQKQGFDITEQDITSQKDGATMQNTGRVHIAKAMVKHGYVQSVSEAFEKYLKRGNCCYAKRLTYSPSESIEMIHNAGGIAVLAHPILISDKYEVIEPVFREMKDAGMDAVECYYNNYTPEFSKMCRELCKKLDMLESGGSDFHGDNKPDVKIGRVSTGYVSYNILEGMKKYRG